MSPAAATSGTGRADQLWGRGLDALFPVGAEGPTPLALAPWPPRSHRRGRPPVDRDLVVAALGAVPRLFDLDPRRLMASQPHVTWEGVAYYLEVTYHCTGRTWADRERLDNQLPLVHRRSDGRQVILGGHHRSAAALVSGRPVRALVVDETEADPDPTAAGAVTPGLLLGDASPLAAMAVASVRAGVSVVVAGGTARTDDPTLARRVLEALGADPADARWRTDRARRGMVRRTPTAGPP